MLGGIVATAELLSARLPRRGEDARDVEAIIEQAVKASRLIRQILAFSRQDLLRPAVADLGGLVAALAPMLGALAGPGIRFGVTRGEPVLVHVDSTALERVIVNLVINAREAVQPRRGVIRVSTARLGPGHRPEAARGFMPPAVYGALSVEDDGPGVDPRHAARIFEPYFTTRANGQGLGLSTAYGLVKQSGGFLLHDRGPLGGARFTVYLPEAAPVAAAPGLAGPRAGRVILLAEDELLLRMSAARGLERLGYRVRQAADGEAALARLEEERPALLISDIRMPGLDGIELTRRARARHPGLPVLLVSGFADEAARAAVPGLDIAWLEKPFTLRSLGERVSELV
jgi:two-component system cell cycle sensor histidine kinase/response regulator CckA